MNNTLKTVSRDENGLIKDIKYSFDDRGMVSWKDMVSPEFLYVNSDIKRRKKIEEKYNKPYSEIDPIIDNVEDQDLIIMLGGLKQLLRIRGFSEVSYSIKESNENYASVNCNIEFIPNFESEGKVQVYSENACAHPANTTNFAKNYLLEIATNRALARCIRNYLNINIVSKEELGSSNDVQEDNKISAPNPSEKLQKILNSKKISFESLKADYKPESDNWNTLDDIPKVKLFAIIGKLQS